MKKILLTGSSKGIGKEVALNMLERGFYVIGISRTPSSIKHDNFEEHLMDLKNLPASVELIEQIISRHRIDILINNAGAGYYGSFFDMKPEHINEMVAVNLTAPMILTNLLLPSLRDSAGAIINISSVTAKQHNNTHGVVYGATKAGLSSFSSSLFSEIRKTGIRVITIHPEMTDTMLYRNADFCAQTAPGCCLYPKDVCDAIIYALEADKYNISDITLTPQFHQIARKKK